MIKNFNEYIKENDEVGLQSKLVAKKWEVVYRPHSFDELYLVLNDVYVEDKSLLVFRIGDISSDYKNGTFVRLIFNTNDKSAVSGIIKNNSKNFTSFRRLSNMEFGLLLNAVYDGVYDRYLDVIKDNTGYDLRDLKNSERGEEYLLNRDIEKYNL